MTEATESEQENCGPDEPDNFFDRLSRKSTLEINYRHMLMLIARAGER